MRQVDFFGVFVGDGQPPQAAVLFRHVHGGPVGEVRDRQVRHLLQGAFVIHHARQSRARLGQITGGLLGTLLFMDVGACAEPAQYISSLVVNRNGSDEMPAVGLPPPIQEPDLHLERSAATDGSRPALTGGVGVVGVEDLRPALVAQGFRQPGELVPLAVHVVDVAVRSCGPHDLRHGVGQLAEALLALPQGVLGTLTVADVGGNAADGIRGAICARQRELYRQGCYGRVGVGKRFLVDAGAAGRQEIAVVPGEARGNLGRE